MKDTNYELHVQNTTRGRVTPVLHAFSWRYTVAAGFHSPRIGDYDRSTGDAAGEAAWREAMAAIVEGHNRALGDG